MTRALAIFMMTLFHAFALGEDIIVPSPEVMLSESDLIATGSLKQYQTGWELIVQESFKGTHKPGDRIRLESQFSPMSFSFDGLAKMVGNDVFLFVGKYDEKAHVARPSYGNCSAWPQGTMEVLLPQRTLADVLSFAKKSLGVADQHTTAGEKENTQPLPTTEKIRPEASTPRPLPSAQPSTPIAPGQKEAAPPTSDEQTSSTPWSIIVVLIVAALGLLWLLLKRRS
jgi:hypothetical protein